MNLNEIFSGAMTTAKWRALGDYLTGGIIRGGVGVRVRTVGGKVIVSARKTRGAAGSSEGPCPFGELTTWTETVGETTETKTGIVGGVIYCGPSNWNITRHELDLSVDGVWLVSIPIDVVVNRDDDDEIILPGIASGTKPEDADWSQTDNSAGDADYPENEEPVVADGMGKIYIPLGQLTVEEGAASFARVACGNITVDQCGGVLSHTRA